MPNSDVYTSTSIHSLISLYTIDALFTVFFSFLCIFVIWRYSVNALETGYRFHLLNMAVWILVCDLTLSILARPYGLFPMNGACFLGELNRWLMGSGIQMELLTKFYIVSGSFFTRLINLPFRDLSLLWSK